MKLKLLNKKIIYKLKKVIILPVVIASTISFAGCTADEEEIEANTEEKKREERKSSVSSDMNSNDERMTYIDEIVDENLNSMELEKDENQIYTIDNEKYNTIVDFSIIDTSIEKNVIDNMYTSYPYSEYYNTKEALNRYYAIEEYDSNNSLKYISNCKIDKEKLKNKVISNNASFLKRTEYTMFSELSSSDFNLAIDAIVDTLNNRLNDEIDIYQLDSNLDKLKIIRTDRGGNASVSNEDMILSINPDVINSLGDSDFFYKVICHEANHLVQINSEIEKKNEKYDRNMGILYTWNDLNVNPLGYQWLIESSAEKIMQDETKEKLGKVMYEDMIKDLDSLSLSCIFNENIDSLTIPKLTLQQDLNKLFELFNCKNDKDKEEIVNMLYTFEIVDDNTNDEFDKFHNEKFGEYLDINERYLLSNYCAETLSKIYYKGLINKLETKSTNLNDVFNLMAINEADMNRITRFHGAYSKEQNDFINYYFNIQQEFFNLISKSTNIEQDELFKMYDEYYNSCTDYNLESNLLENNQKEILGKIIETRFEIKPSDNLYTYVNK